jgi:alpha-L-fucosidase 2
MQWREGKLSSAKILSRSGNECVLRTNMPLRVKDVKVVSKKTDSNMVAYETRFKTQAGKVYIIEAAE